MASPTTTEIGLLHDREWVRLSRPGAGFSGNERVAIAAAARGADDSSLAGAAARKIYDAPARITREWLAELEAKGLTLAQYVEVLGIASRLRALDTTVFGLGDEARELPRAVPGGPTGSYDQNAKLDGGWVPTVGPAFPPTVLSSAPAENEAMHDVHAVLYLAATADQDGDSMGNMTVVRDGLSRSQMEFVAARTSLLNDCFF